MLVGFSLSEIGAAIASTRRAKGTHGPSEKYDPTSGGAAEPRPPPPAAPAPRVGLRRKSSAACVMIDPVDTAARHTTTTHRPSFSVSSPSIAIRDGETDPWPDALFQYHGQRRRFQPRRLQCLGQPTTNYASETSPTTPRQARVQALRRGEAAWRFRRKVDCFPRGGGVIVNP